MAAPLVCPGCGSAPDGERFCPDCGLPLVARGEVKASRQAALARKIDPRYAQGPLVWAAGARNQVEAELIAGLLLEEGVPSLIRRAPGFDVPDFMASGPRDVFVPQSALEAAREMLRPVGGRPAVARTGSSISLATRLVALALLAIVLLTIVLFMRTPGTEGAIRRLGPRAPTCPTAARCRSLPAVP